MYSDIDALDALMLHLQAADLTVGIDTRLRLRVLFTQAGLPEDPERVANMVAAIVAHDPREAEAARQATLAWARQAPVPWREPDVAPRPEHAPKLATDAPKGTLLLWALLVLGGAALTWWILDTDPAGTAIRKGIDAVTPSTVASGVPYSAASKPEAVRFLKEAPALEIRVERARPRQRTTWPFWALACFGVGVAAYGWRRTRPPGAPVPPPGPELPPRRTRPRAERRPRFVTGRDADTLAWGIDRYLSDEPTGRLNLPGTVAATVKAGGLPHLRWQRARQHREIWLWIDDAAVRAHPEIAQLTTEVQQALARVGLRPKIAHFWGVPDALSHDDGAIRIDQLEEVRMSARVAVLTDGRLWTRWRSEPASRRAADRALRRLAGWRQLAIFDFADGQWPIADLARHHAIPAHAPEGLIGWLGEFETRAGETSDDDRTAWAAACALCPEPVSEDDALALLQALRPVGVEASPWSIRALREDAPGPGRRLRWPAPQRATLLTWMSAAEQGEDSLLTHAQRFWRARLTGDDPRRVAQRAWLDLFTAPEAALRTLLGLTHAADADDAAGDAIAHQPVAVGADVTHALPMDLAGPHAIALPWRWADLDGESRLTARAIGLGRAVGGLPDEVLVRPGRVGLAAGLGLGTALAAVIIALWPHGELSDPPQVIENAVGATVEIDPEGQYAIARTPWMATYVKDLKPGARLRIVEGTRSCEDEQNGALLLRCGTIPRPVRANPSVVIDQGEPQARYTVAVIAARPDAPSKTLAARLLDTGSVDMVLIDPTARPDALLGGQSGLRLSETKGLFFGGVATAKGAATPDGWCQVPGQLEALADRVGDGMAVALGAVWSVVSGDESCPKVRGRATDWQRQLMADSKRLDEALQSDYPLENALAALVYVPEDLVWTVPLPIGWGLVGAETSAEFTAAIDARIKLIEERMTGADRDAARSLVRFLGEHPSNFKGTAWNGAIKALDALAHNRYIEVIEEVNRREVGWRRVRIREQAKALYAVNQRVVGDYPFGQSQSDASIANAQALFDEVRSLKGSPPASKNSGVPANPFAGQDAAAVLGRQQGEWVTGFEELVAMEEQIGRWPVQIGGLVFEVKGGKGGWHRAKTWRPGEAIRLCWSGKEQRAVGPYPSSPSSPSKDCVMATGDWALLRLIDHDKPLSKAARRLTQGVRIGSAGDNRAGFWPKAVDFPALPAPVPGLIGADGACPYTCQMRGWAKGTAVGDRCRCGE